MTTAPSDSQASPDASSAPGASSPVYGAERFGRVWRAWLSTLGHDSDAATAAASLYAELPTDGRDAWLEALAEDAPVLGIDPAVVYGPLLAVETDEARRQRIVRQAGETLAKRDERPWALVGRGPAGGCVAAIVRPLYPGFARLLVARFHRAHGVEWIREQSIATQAELPTHGTEVEGCVLAPAALDDVIDELAHSVVAHVRARRPVSDSLRAVAGLIVPRRAPSPDVER
jgi:hypothetical protein